MLKEQFQYYLDNQNTLIRDYNGQHLVIKDKNIVGAFPSHQEAYSFASSKYDLGTFLIQLCSSGNDAYTQTFYSRVSFVSL